jgi:hypothetical protein
MDEEEYKARGKGSQERVQGKKEEEPEEEAVIG